MRLSKDPGLGNPLPVQLEDTIPIVNQTRDPNLEHLHCILHNQARSHYNSPSAAYGKHWAWPTRQWEPRGVRLGATLQRLKALARGPLWWTLQAYDIGFDREDGVITGHHDNTEINENDESRKCSHGLSVTDMWQLNLLHPLKTWIIFVLGATPCSWQNGCCRPWSQYLSRTYDCLIGSRHWG